MTKRFCNRCGDEIGNGTDCVQVSTNICNKYTRFELCGNCLVYIKTQLQTPPTRCSPPEK